MRTLTTQQSSTLAAGDYATHVRVWIDKTGSGSFADVTDVDGRDWLDSLDLRDSIDDTGIGATVTLRREEYEISLATLMENSKMNQQPIGAYVPFVQIGRDIKIEAAVLPVGAEPVSTDWVNIFEGEIDDVDWGGVEPFIRLTCRDQSGYLMDRWIEENTEYGAAEGTPVETIMQNILTAWAPGVTLAVSGTPGWNILPYEQQKEPVIQALRNLAAQIGWDVKYRWDTGSSSWKLTLFEPDRALAVPNHTFGTAAVTAISQLRISREGIRNYVRVVYTNSVSGKRESVFATDAPSVTKYGRRFMEIAEAGTSQIDSSSEAQTLADIVLLDLKEPNAEMTVEVSGFPFVETGDLYRFTANGRHFSTNQDLAVVGWSMTLGLKCSTTFTVRGLPAGAYQRWLGAEARPGVAPATDTEPPAKPSGVSAIAKLGGLEITYDMPRELDWSYSEVYVSKATGFSPGLDTKAGDGRTNNFFLGSLEPNTVYYFRVVAIDSRGNKSEPSDEAQQTTSTAGTVALNWESAFDGNVIPNGDFQIWSSPLTPDTSPPDLWEVADRINHSGAILYPDRWINSPGLCSAWYDTTRQSTGNYALRLRARRDAVENTLLVRLNRLLPVRAGRLYTVLANFQADTPGGTPSSAPLVVQIQQLDRTGAHIGFLELFCATTLARTWTTQSRQFMMSANCTHIRIGVSFSAFNNVETDYYVDRIEMKPSLPSFSVYDEGTNDKAIAGSTFTEANLTAFEWDSLQGSTIYSGISLSDGSGLNASYEIPWDGEYEFEGAVALINLIAGTTMRAAIYVNGVLYKLGETVPHGSFSYDGATVSVRGQFHAGDIVQLMVYHDDAGATEAGEVSGARQWFSGRCVQEGTVN